MLVRGDLPPPAQAVQAGHALAQYMLDHPNIWKNEYLIYLKVKDERDLKMWMWKLDMSHIPYSTFYEPDLENSLTAISSISDGKIFKKLKLLDGSVAQSG